MMLKFTYQFLAILGTLVEDLSHVTSWVEIVQIMIGVLKCFVLHIGYGNLRTNYEVENISIPSIRSVCDLGIVISDDLKFGLHCGQLLQKAYIICLH